MKRIVVIAGVTGSVGSALLAEYAQDKNTVIYGISRKALPLSTFLENNKLPQKTLICAVDIPSGYKDLFQSIDFSDVEEVAYVHAMGMYPFEVNVNGDLVVENDFDGDGINDDTFMLTYKAFTVAVTQLLETWKGKTNTIIFGSASDVYEPVVHQSWWRTFKKVKEFSKEVVEKNQSIGMYVFNISSVICPHELITRPFVFVHTDADQTKWLHPHELSQFVLATTEKGTSGFHEIDKFRIKENFNPDEYYKDSMFTPRKVSELYDS